MVRTSQGGTRRTAKLLVGIAIMMGTVTGLAAACLSGPPTSPTATTTTNPAVPVIASLLPEHFNDGEWVAGTDFAPGEYRTASNESADCYWWVYLAGYPPAHMLDHLIARESSMMKGPIANTRPEVTLAAGQEIQVWHCGAWNLVKQG